MRTVTLPGGERVPALGLGTWMLGEDPATEQEELRALQRGIDLGLGLIDTAEMYGEGAAETLVGRALRGRREQVFLVSKVYPHHAGRRELVAACERSLQRLGVECLDLYLLHWRGRVPLAETVAGFEQLRAAGRIRHWGVSNLDHDDLRQLAAVDDGHRCATDQVLYNLVRRGVEWELLPWCRARSMPVMAYSPLEQARLLQDRGLVALARERGLAPAVLALAWLLHQPEVIAIPKSGRVARVEQFAQARELTLDDATLAALTARFPAPAGPQPLAML